MLEAIGDDETRCVDTLRVHRFVLVSCGVDRRWVASETHEITIDDL